MDLLYTFIGNFSIGFQEAASLSNLWYCFVGVFLGCMVGVLPGLGALVAITLLLPITYYLPANGAIIMLAGVYFGADYGGGTSSILLGVPGHAAAAVDVLDGYPMAKQGRAGIALFMKCVASFWGSMVGIVLLMMFAPILSQWALLFGAAEYTALILLALVAVSTVGQGSPVKGIAMMVVGLICGVVGLDVDSGVYRFHFGITELSDGLSLVAIAMGLFAITEIIKSANATSDPLPKQPLGLRDQLPTRDDWRRSIFPMLRGSGIGAFFGALPGSSGGSTTFLSYAVEKRLSKHPEKFGNGAIEGLAGPEACNNAGVGTSFIPTLTLGVPGDAVMALILGALTIQGITPGPLVISSHPDLFWGLIVSFWIGNIILVILNIPLIGIWIRMLSIPYRILFPAIVVFTCIGVYSTKNSVFDVYVLLGFGLAGYLMALLRFEIVPVLLGFILGPMLEENFRRAMVLSRGDFSTFIDSPISAAVMLFTLLVLIWSVLSYLKRQSAAPSESGKKSKSA